jgi:hypothetical protein
MNNIVIALLIGLLFASVSIAQEVVHREEVGTWKISVMSGDTSTRYIMRNVVRKVDGDHAFHVNVSSRDCSRTRFAFSYDIYNVSGTYPETDYKEKVAFRVDKGTLYRNEQQEVTFEISKGLGTLDTFITVDPQYVQEMLAGSTIRFSFADKVYGSVSLEGSTAAYKRITQLCTEKKFTELQSINLLKR